jgi:hypothetical protein
MIIFFTSRNVFKKWEERERERERARGREVMAETGFTPLGYLLLQVNATSRYFLLLLVSGVGLSYNLPSTWLVFLLATVLVSSTTSNFRRSVRIPARSKSCKYIWSTVINNSFVFPRFVRYFKSRMFVTSRTASVV